MSILYLNFFSSLSGAVLAAGEGQEVTAGGEEEEEEEG